MNNRNANTAELRRRAMESLKSRLASIEKMPVADVSKLIEELQIHQVELEMQNEELRYMQSELEQSRKKYSDLYEFAPVGYLTINEEGRIVEANLTAAKQLGMERCILIGKPINLYAAEDYRDELHLHLRNVFQTKRPHSCEIRLDGRNKINRYVQLDSTCFSDSDGQSLTLTTMTDISDRKQAEEKLGVLSVTLEQSNRELERSNRELEQFAFIASHDLQEPLRKIQAFGNMVWGKYNDKLDEQGRDYLVRMKNAATRMQQFITDLLNFSRVATRTEPLKTVDLREVVTGVISDLEVMIERMGAKVEVLELAAVRADKGQIRQVIQNLIANALKFHREEKPHIKVYSRLTDHDCQIFVEDNGIGFDEKYLDHIFVPFQRIHGRAYEGTGMGLAICRKIVERHGGGITAKSTLGAGSTFIVTLPLSDCQKS